MQRYVLSSDEFEFLTETRETVKGWDEIYKQFKEQFPKYPIDRKKLQRAYGYSKGLLDGQRSENKQRNPPRKRKAPEDAGTRVDIKDISTGGAIDHSSFLTRSLHAMYEENTAFLSEISLYSQTIRALIDENDDLILRLYAEMTRTQKIEEDLKQRAEQAKL
jgi:hypothetical protein